MKFTYEIDPCITGKGPIKWTYEIVHAKSYDEAHEMAMEIYPDADYYIICCDLLGQCGPRQNVKKSA